MPEISMIRVDGDSFFATVDGEEIWITSRTLAALSGLPDIRPNDIFETIQYRSQSPM